MDFKKDNNDGEVPRSDDKNILNYVQVIKDNDVRTDLLPEEQELYEYLRIELYKEFDIEKVVDKMMVDRALFNYIFAQRGSNLLLKQGMVVKDYGKGGVSTKINPVVQAMGNADKRFVELLTALKATRAKRGEEKISDYEQQEMKIIFTRLKKLKLNDSKLKSKKKDDSDKNKVIDVEPEK